MYWVILSFVKPRVMTDSHTSLKGVNELIFVIHALLADLGEIRFKRSAHQFIEHLRVSWKQAREDRVFLMGLNKITFTHVPYFESKERLGNTCVLRHWVHHLHSVQPSTTCSQPFVSLSEVTHFKYVFKIYIPLCQNVSHYTAITFRGFCRFQSIHSLFLYMYIFLVCHVDDMFRSLLF